MFSKIKMLLDKLKYSKEARNASWIIVSRIFRMIITFIISIYTTRYLGPAHLGTINYATAYVIFFTSLCSLGIDSVIVKEFVSHPDEQGTALGTTFVLRAASGMLSSLLIISIVSVVDAGETLTLAVAALCSVSLVFQISETVALWFQSKYNSKVIAVAAIIAYTISAVYKISLIIAQKDVRWFAFSTAAENICLAVLYLLAYKIHNGPKLRFSLAKGKAILKQSYHYILSGMMIAIYNQTDRFMLKQMMNEESVGYYSLASSVNNLWVFVLTAIINSFAPTIIQLFSDGKKKEFDRKNRQLYAIVIYSSLFAALMLVLFGKPAIILVYGENYAPASVPLKILAWLTAFSYLGVARNVWIVCENKQKYLKYMYFGAAIINIVLNVIFIPLWGASGAAAASLLTQICTSMILPSLIKELRPNTKLMLEAFGLRKLR